MAIHWTEAQIEEIVKAVVANVKTAPKAAEGTYSSTAYAGRTLIGIYETMEEAIAAAPEKASAKIPNRMLFVFSFISVSSFRKVINLLYTHLFGKSICIKSEKEA